MLKMAGFILIGCVGVTTMIVRRPGKNSGRWQEPAASASIPNTDAEPGIRAASNRAMVLQLVRVTRQTGGCEDAAVCADGEQARDGAAGTVPDLYVPV